MNDETLCNKCGKNTTNEAGQTIRGLSIQVINNQTDEEYTKFLQEQLGPYSINKKYVLCFECWLRALGIRP